MKHKDKYNKNKEKHGKHMAMIKHNILKNNIKNKLQIYI